MFKVIVQIIQVLFKYINNMLSREWIYSVIISVFDSPKFTTLSKLLFEPKYGITIFHSLCFSHQEM